MKCQENSGVLALYQVNNSHYIQGNAVIFASFIQAFEQNSFLSGLVIAGETLCTGQRIRVARQKNDIIAAR